MGSGERSFGSRLKRFFQSLLTLIISLVVVYLIGEALVFAIHRDKIALFPRYVTDVHYGEFHIRGNVPNSHYWHKSADGRWEFFINGQGFRDTREFAYEKPEGRTRVLVLGDSFTIGYEAAQDETYAAILERYLTRRGMDVEVINAGMSGSSTAEALVLLEQEAIKYHPDYVVLGYYWNDLEDNLKADLYRLDGGELVVNRKEYVPAIRIRNMLNSFGLYRWLSEHSYLHNYLNNVATVYFKQRLLEQRMAALEESGAGGEQSKESVEGYKNDLGRALVKRVYDVCKENGAEFVLLDIASRDLERSFPWAGPSDLGNVCDVYVDTVPILEPYSGLIELRVVHGDGHWTPFSHLMAGVAIGDAILETRGAVPTDDGAAEREATSPSTI